MTISRLTFHDIVDGTAWQKKIRDERAHHYSDQGNWWDNVNTSLKRAVVRECSRSQAEKIIIEYEWLGTMPAITSWCTGLFFDGWACGGASVFGIGAGVHVPNEFGLHQRDIAYLARGACTHWTPNGSASKLIGYSLKIAKQRGYKIAIAYSDTDAGEIGTVYQATNWLCIGRGASTSQLVHPNGRIYDQKRIYDCAKNRAVTRKEALRQLLDAGFKEQKTNPKWRYCYILAEGDEGKRIYERIESKIVPYPKRPKDSSEPLCLPA